MRRTLSAGLLVVGVMAGSLTACSNEAEPAAPVYERTGNIDGFGFTEEQSFSHQEWVHENHASSLPSGNEPIRNVNEHEEVTCFLVQDYDPQDSSDDSNIFDEEDPMVDYYEEDYYTDDWEFKSKPLIVGNKLAGYDDIDCVREGYISFDDTGHYEVFSKDTWYSFDVLRTLWRYCKVRNPRKYETQHVTPEINEACSQPNRGETQGNSTYRYYLFFDIDANGVQLSSNSTSTTIAEGDYIPSTARFEVSDIDDWQSAELHQPVNVRIQDGSVVGFDNRSLR